MTMCSVVCVHEFPYSALFDNDDFTPLTVETEDRYQGVVEVFPYEDITLSRKEFPKSFPFSGFVLQIYQQVSQAIIKNCYSILNTILLK